jgi:hypothetical protein
MSSIRRKGAHSIKEKREHMQPGQSAEHRPPLAGRQLWTLRFALAAATCGEICPFAFTLDQTEGSRGQAAVYLSGLVSPALVVYVLGARSRIGSILTGTAIAGGVLLALVLAPGSGEGNGLELLWVPFIAWVAALAGRAAEGVFKRWDHEREW